MVKPRGSPWLERKGVIGPPPPKKSNNFLIQKYFQGTLKAALVWECLLSKSLT